MADSYKIYSGDYTKDGYDQGIKDSKQHTRSKVFGDGYLLFYEVTK